MEQRVLGRTGRPVPVVGLGTWQLGADWGDVSEADAMEVLRAAAESGVTFFDTAGTPGTPGSPRTTTATTTPAASQARQNAEAASLPPLPQPGDF